MYRTGVHSLQPPNHGRFKPSSLFSSLKNIEISCPFCFCVMWVRKVGTMKTRVSPAKKTSGMKGMAGLSCCTANKGQTGKPAVGGSRPLPPCGWWQRRRMAGVWSEQRSWVWWGLRALRGAGRRKWRCGGSWATAACGRRRWPAACGTVAGSGLENALGKCSWLWKKFKKI